MQSAIHSYPSYFSVSQARSRDSGVHFLSEGPPDPKKHEDLVPTVNGIILLVCKIMRNIMASASKAEYGTIFINAQTDVPIRTTLNEMGWKQGATASWQLHSSGHCNKIVFRKEIKGSGYVILLDKRHNWTRTISSLLENGPRKPRGLSFQTSATWTSHRCLIQIFTCS